jgi:uncharacterized protein (TIGR02391 family)
MASGWALFERVARRAHEFVLAEPAPAALQHPFDERNIHPGLPPKVRNLFDDGHYAEATFHAFKYLDKTVGRHAKLKKTGWNLMMDAFTETGPPIQLTPLVTDTEIDEQKGFKFLFGGGVWAIRNPRGHEFSIVDDPDKCLDHLSFISMLIRRLEDAGYV